MSQSPAGPTGFNDVELWFLRGTLHARHGAVPELQLRDAGRHLARQARELPQETGEAPLR